MASSRNYFFTNHFIVLFLTSMSLADGVIAAEPQAKDVRVGPLAKAADGLVAWWQFDGIATTWTKDAVSGIVDDGHGNLDSAQGATGKAMRGDGFTTAVVRAAAQAPDLTKRGFTIEAWIAPQEYSWNWTGLVDQEQVVSAWKDAAPVKQNSGMPGEAIGGKAGYSLGINHLGQVGLYAAIGGQWQGCLSKEPVALLKWSHVAGVYDPAVGFRIHVNGKLVEENKTQGAFTPAQNTDLWLGMSHRKQSPTAAAKRFYYAMVFDGLLDEVRIYDRALSAADIQQAYSVVKPGTPQPLQYRRIPTGPVGPGRFGAFYTRLKYCDEWDRLWRVADHPDIVVQFDESPTKLIFWRGTGYIPYWVAENGVCVADQGVETASPNTWGCCEAMSDKQCRYSHVRIIESTPARTVVHWRTASPDVRYEFCHVNPDTGWSEWTDEYFYTYPDGVSVRYQLVHGDVLAGWMEYQQIQTLNQPGTRPEDNLETVASTILNMDGGKGSYIWDRPRGRWGNNPGNANIQVTNLKARNRHYVIGEPGSRWEPFTWAGPSWTFFPTWNHWPVAQLNCDGRDAAAPDRPSSSCPGTLSGVKHKVNETAVYLRDLYGMTDQPVETLVTLARSWNFPAELKLSAGDFKSQGYDKNQRAYVLTSMQPNNGKMLELTLEGSKNSPVLNPAFVIKNWGDADVKLTLNGRDVPRGKAFRFGHVATLERTDLVIWIKLESVKTVNIRVSPDEE